MLDFLKNLRGGLIGVAAALTLWILVYFMAFMAAFGNPTPTAEFVLSFAGVFFTLANPLWLLPTAYVLGAYYVR